MTFRRNSFSTGDKCFLFSKFKIDPNLFHKLPIELYPGIHLTLTPQHALHQGAGRNAKLKEHIALANWVYPGYGLNMGICNSCIKIDAGVKDSLRDRFFWLMLGALFLTKPLDLRITGSFTYGDEEAGLLGKNPSMINHRSNICLETNFRDGQKQNFLQYDEQDLNQAVLYFSRLVEIFNSIKTASRPFFVLKSFFEATLWERLLYASTIFSKFFPLIDALVGNPHHDHCKKASNRLSFFLEGVSSIQSKILLEKQQIKERIKSIWDLHRPPTAHGFLKKISFPQEHSIDQDTEEGQEFKDLFDLMEISRLAIIKILLLDKDIFHDYCQIPFSFVYSSKEEKNDNNCKRNKQSTQFFERNYPNPDCLIAYTDFLSC